MSPQLSPKALNEFFVSVGPRVTAELAGGSGDAGGQTRLQRVGAFVFAVSHTTLDTLSGVLGTMRDSPACGSDGVVVRALKAGFPAVGHVILHIINSCITQSDYPPSWKRSIIHPIFKTGDTSDPSNYRPI